MRRTSAVLLLLIYLGVYGNQLALWNDTDKEPVQILPYRLELYPPEDQCALRHGIPVTSAEDLCRLAEDYFS